MSEVGMGEGQLAPWSFDPVALDPGRTEAIARVAPIVRVIDNMRARFRPDEEAFVPDDKRGYWRRSVLLHTPSGPVHYYRAANEHHDNGSLAVEYPGRVGALPEGLLGDILGVEPAELHADFPYKRAGHEERRLVASWRFPEPDADGRHVWLRDEKGTVVNHAGKHIKDIAVIGGVLGEVQVPEMRTVALETGNGPRYVEAEPQTVGATRVRELEDRFKQLAIAVAGYMGGADQLSAATHEEDPRVLSYHAVGTQRNQSAARVTTGLAFGGYDVTEYRRVAEEGVDSRYRVLVARRSTARGRETVAVHEGLSSFWYAQGSREWHITRGLVVRGEVQVEDFDTILAPIVKGKSA